MDDLFVTNGWTALWDGVRVANDLLADVAVEAGPSETCVSGSFAAIVAFTDGADNNSADEHASVDYPGDGVDTTADDAGSLRVFDALTPVFTVGVGDEVDEVALEAVATPPATTSRSSATGCSRGRCTGRPASSRARCGLRAHGRAHHGRERRREERGRGRHGDRDPADLRLTTASKVAAGPLDPVLHLR